MRHPARTAATGVAAALLAATAACGSGNALQGLSPGQIVTLASSKVTGQSYRMAISATESFDASGVHGLPAGMLQQMSGSLPSFRISGSGEVQNSQRIRVAMTLSLPTVGDRKVVAVAYDGHYYTSIDGGRTFADAGTLSLQGVASTPDDVKALLQGATDVKDLGTTVHDGERVEHLRANLGKDYFNHLFDSFIGSGSAAAAMQQVRTLFAQVITISTSSLDIYVRTLDGRIEATDMHAVMSLDMGKLVSLLTGQYGGRIPSGSHVSDVSGAVVLTLSGTTRFTDYGAKIAVSKPTVDPNAPSLQNVFGGS